MVDSTVEWQVESGVEHGEWRVECGECRKSENAVETEWRVQWKEWLERPLELKKGLRRGLYRPLGKYKKRFLGNVLEAPWGILRGFRL